MAPASSDFAHEFARTVSRTGGEHSLDDEGSAPVAEIDISGTTPPQLFCGPAPARRDYWACQTRARRSIVAAGRPLSPPADAAAVLPTVWAVDRRETATTPRASGSAVPVESAWTTRRLPRRWRSRAATTSWCARASAPSRSRSRPRWSRCARRVRGTRPSARRPGRPASPRAATSVVVDGLPCVRQGRHPGREGEQRTEAAGRGHPAEPRRRARRTAPSRPTASACATDRTSCRRQRRHRRRAVGIVSAARHDELRAQQPVLGSGEWASTSTTATASRCRPATSSPSTPCTTTERPRRRAASASKASGEIRDNLTVASLGPGVKTDTQPTCTSTTTASSETPFRSRATSRHRLRCGANVEQDPPSWRSACRASSCSSFAAGQASESPMVDSGSGGARGATFPADAHRRPARRRHRRHRLSRGCGGLDRQACGRNPPTGDPTPASVHYVDPVRRLRHAHAGREARSQATPWKTISFRDDQGVRGRRSRSRLAPTRRAGDDGTLRGQARSGVVIAAPTGAAGVNVTASHRRAHREPSSPCRAQRGVTATMADGIRVTGVAVVSPSTVGIRVRQTNGCPDRRLHRHRGRQLRHPAATHEQRLRAQQSRLRERGWGISVDADGFATSTGNVVAFNTIHQNGSGLRS